MTSRVVYKYPLQVFGFDYGAVEVPEGDVVLIAYQHGTLHAWIQHRKDTIHRMTLEIIPTGVQFNDSGKAHVGSAKNDEYVWHVYRSY